MSNILIIPIGEIDNTLLDFIKEELKSRFHQEVEISSPLPIPAYAYNPKRDQYHSTPILEEISSSTKYKHDKLLGIIDVDLYVPELNFVFGEAQTITGKAAIISITRLRQEFYGLTPNQKLFQERALKEAVHELGHLFGLMHCKDPNCVMHFSNSILDTDRKSSHFCLKCKEKLQL